MEKLYIVIPTYNEEMNITSVAREWLYSSRKL